MQFTRHLCVRHFNKMFVLWLLVFAALIGARLAWPLVHTPWAIVLFPLWGPPALSLAYRLVRRLLWLLLFVVAWVLAG